MDRRAFLKTLFAGIHVAMNSSFDVDKTVELTLTKTEFMADDEFVQYIMWSMFYLYIILPKH